MCWSDFKLHNIITAGNGIIVLIGFFSEEGGLLKMTPKHNPLPVKNIFVQVHSFGKSSCRSVITR